MVDTFARLLAIDLFMLLLQNRYFNIQDNTDYEKLLHNSFD